MTKTKKKAKLTAKGLKVAITVKSAIRAGRAGYEEKRK